jgi:hypothetical protein
MWRGSRQGKLSAGRSCRIPASARKAAILSSPIGTLLENRRNLPAPARSQALCTQTHSRSRHARRARTFSRAFIGSPIVKQHPRKDRNDRHCFSLSGFQSRWENAHETLNLTIASIFVCSDQWLKRRQSGGSGAGSSAGGSSASGGQAASSTTTGHERQHDRQQRPKPRSFSRERAERRSSKQRGGKRGGGPHPSTPQQRLLHRTVIKQPRSPRGFCLRRKLGCLPMHLV